MEGLAARGLWVSPAGVPESVVRDVSLEVARGERLALTGPNGGGKSTLALALAGLLAPRQGEVRWAGEALGPARRVRHDAPIAVVLQDPSTQLLAASVADEIALTARNLGLAEEGIASDRAELARRLALDRSLEDDPRTLSAGQQQLVLIAAALCARPALLVADEATSHVDAAGVEAVRELLEERAAAGLATVWVTQNEAELARADRVIEVGADQGIDKMTDGPAAAPGAVRFEVEVGLDCPAAGPRVRLARPLRFTIGERGVTVLTGPNGAGKTVILMALAGLARVPQVRVRAAVAPAAAPLFVGQYPERQIFEERVEEELLFAAVRRGRARAEALAALSAMAARLGWDAGALFPRRTWTLSGGEKRAVELLAALAAPAGLLALDEPTAGLDRGRRRALAALVRERAASLPVVVASQDLAWAEGIGGQAVRIGDGAATETPSASKKTD